MKYITNILAIIGLDLICTIPICALSDIKARFQRFNYFDTFKWISIDHILFPL